VLLSYPLVLLLIVGMHLRAVWFDRGNSPFQPQEIQYGEAAGVIQFTLVLVTPLLVIAVAANWALIRRLAVHGAGRRLGVVLLTIALLTAPAYLLGEYLTAG
jgi:hypothetical protein